MTSCGPPTLPGCDSVSGVKIVSHRRERTAGRDLGCPLLPKGGTPAGCSGVPAGKLHRLRATPTCCGA